MLLRMTIPSTHSRLSGSMLMNVSRLLGLVLRLLFLPDVASRPLRNLPEISFSAPHLHAVLRNVSKFCRKWSSTYHSCPFCI
jgi:hypothetical protein